MELDVVMKNISITELAPALEQKLDMFVYCVEGEAKLYQARLMQYRQMGRHTLIHNPKYYQKF